MSTGQPPDPRQDIRLKKFFSRLMNEVIHFGADTVVFAAGPASLKVSLVSGGNQLKNTSIKLFWQNAIRNFLHRHLTFAGTDPGQFHVRLISDDFRSEFHADCPAEGDITLSDFRFSDSAARSYSASRSSPAPVPGDLEKLPDDFFMSESGSAPASRPVRPHPLILVAEDNEDQRAIMKMVLEESGYQVETAADGLEALSRIRENIPDLLISDMMMPGLDGPGLVAEMKKIPACASVPILMFTVLTDPEKEYQLLNLGADDYCEKTVQRKILLKRIENLLRRGN